MHVENNSKKIFPYQKKVNFSSQKWKKIVNENYQVRYLVKKLVVEVRVPMCIVFPSLKALHCLLLWFDENQGFGLIYYDPPVWCDVVWCGKVCIV